MEQQHRRSLQIHCPHRHIDHTFSDARALFRQILVDSSSTTSQVQTHSSSESQQVAHSSPESQQVAHSSTESQQVVHSSPESQQVVHSSPESQLVLKYQRSDISRLKSPY